MYWQNEVEKILTKHSAKPVKIHGISSIGGGSINDAFRLVTSVGNFFIKVNSASRYPGMFEKESLGLKMLSATQTLSVPDIVAFGEAGNDSFLLLSFIESRSQTSNFWPQFGEQLADLHRHSNPTFGLDHDNYIGSLIQHNNAHETWADFFREERLEPQLKLACDQGRVDSEVSRAFQRFYLQLDQLFPTEPPALVHGDLWSGNFMRGNQGEPVIIDPAVYFGHREMDLAMSQLFGGFSPSFYEAYQSAFPMENGCRKRLDYCNLYPLMVHVNLFGGGYLGSVKSILRSF
ncbi:MAG: fructosamine kinase family protein [Aeromonas bestiarum]